jgi:Zn-dependent protease/CBS domain-containing protein
MHDAWQIGRLLGIPLRIHLSWLLIFGLVTWSLAAGYFPAVVPDMPAWSYWAKAIVAAAMLFGSVILHELGHSLMARRHGVAIAGITLFVFGGVSEMKEEPRTPGQELQIAIVGPAISVLLGVAFALLGGLLGAGGELTSTGAVVGYLAWINFLLAAFNMLPAFPLDGGRVLRAILWRWQGDMARATRTAAGTGRVLAFAMMGFGLFQVFSGRFGGLWLLLVGWFIMQAGSAGAVQASLRQALAGLKVRDVMTADVRTVEAGMAVADVIEQHFLRHTYGGYPVERRGEVIGLVTLHELRGVPSGQRREVPVEKIMVPLSADQVVDGETTVLDAFNRMAATRQGRLVILDGGRLRGLITLRGVAHLAQVRGYIAGASA